MKSKGILSYRKANVITADPKRLVIMCYEGAVDNLKLGKQKIMEKDYEAKSRAFIKTQDIIEELICALDYENGGNIAKNLKALYNYILRRMVQADLKNDTEAIDESIGILNELKSAWEEISYTKIDEAQPEIVGFIEEKRHAQSYISV